jgi:hypothetical protein
MDSSIAPITMADLGLPKLWLMEIGFGLFVPGKHWRIWVEEYGRGKKRTPFLLIFGSIGRNNQ